MPIPEWDIVTTTRVVNSDIRMYFLLKYDNIVAAGTRDYLINEINRLRRHDLMPYRIGQNLIDSIRGK